MAEVLDGVTLWCISHLFLSRSLGVHCSKVRSLTLDSWEPELLKVCERLLKMKLTGAPRSHGWDLGL